MNGSVRALALTLAMVAAVVGCSGGDEDGLAMQLEELVVAAEAAGAGVQADIMRDGEVTDEELLVAVRAARTCVQDLGLSVSGIERRWDGDLAYSFHAGDDGLVEAADKCQEDHSMLVQQAYKLLNPTDVGPIVDRFNLCSAEYGYDAVEATSTMELREFVWRDEADTQLLDCYTSAFPVTLVEE